MPVSNFDFDAAKSGRIYWNGSSYTAYTGWNQCATGQDGDANHKDRAFLSFDTSSIPNGAVINSVKFMCRRGADPEGDPQTYQIRYYIGTFIGAALDGNVGEWTAGTICLTQVSKPLDKTTYDLGSAAVEALNDSGDTDLKIADNSIEGSGDPTWGTNFNKNTGTRCKLVVDYTEAELGSATLTGAGTLSATGTVSGGIEGSATMTGIGTVSATAVLEIPGAATLTGVGTAMATAVVILLGAATLTGVGMISGSPVLEIPGAATLTGVGTASGSPVLEVPGAATLTGVGTVTAAGTVSGVSYASATMTGIGTVSATAVLEIPGTAMLTGVGSATATAVLELSNSATMTGIAIMSATATLWLAAAAVLTGIGTVSAAGVVGGNIAHWGEPLEGYTGGPQRGAY